MINLLKNFNFLFLLLLLLFYLKEETSSKSVELQDVYFRFMFVLCQSNIYGKTG